MKFLKLLGLLLITFSFFNCSKEDDELFINEMEALEKSNTYSNIKWTGTWNSTYGELRFIEKGQLIYGDYGNTGVIYGYRHYINGKEYFEGTFENYRMNRKGIIRFEMKNPNFNNSFSGEWVWNNSSNWYNWNGSKISKKEPSLQSFYNVKGQVIDTHTSQKILSPISIEVFKNGIRHFYTLSENGLYALQLPKGNWELRVTDSNYQVFSRNIQVKEIYDYNDYFTQNIFLIK
ncbi:hypothetical protein [Aquimarina litoralis]|uniref:hypothetical protein n=1 Tax=Aquimarina litoralis TaxID=584605 RepID=UPI001C58D8E5|nr:hypothetical protein [Aquimarina litoralis]MBW1298697.1 hypothetical protein [Aquimarina litoralis]